MNMNIEKSDMLQSVTRILNKLCASHTNKTKNTKINVPTFSTIQSSLSFHCANVLTLLKV